MPTEAGSNGGVKECREGHVQSSYMGHGQGHMEGIKEVLDVEQDAQGGVAVCTGCLDASRVWEWDEIGQEEGSCRVQRA
jgi:hypothetical protein